MKYFLRIYHTIRHIKLIQLYYQIWYRIKDRFLSINWYKGYRYSEIRSFQINVDAILQTGYQEFTADNRFSFIGIHHHFKNNKNSKVCIIVTSDKCYDNNNKSKRFNENHKPLCD